MNNNQEDGQFESLKCGDGPKQETAVSITATEEVDEFIDQNIQINSNKQMRQEYLYSWTLKFKDINQEAKYCQLREDMFRSNMLCVYVVWVFIVLCQAIIVPRCTFLVICLAVSTLLLTAGCILVMAEEFTGLPVILRKSSAILVHHRNRRTLFICSVITLMSIASSIGLFLCPMSHGSNGNPGEEIASNGTTITTTATGTTVNSRILYLNPTSSAPLSDDHNYDTEIHLNVLISAIIHQNSSKSIDDLDPDATTKTSDWKSYIPSSLFQKILNQTNDDLVNGTILNDTDIAQHSIFLSQNNREFPSEVPVEGGDPKPICLHPEYMVYTWVLCLIALATGLKLYYLVKTFMALIMVGCYATLILIIFPDVFARTITDTGYTRLGMPLSAQMNILLIVFLTMVTYHARLVEVTSRLDFIWKEQAEKELSNMKSNRMLNDLLIKVRPYDINF